MLSLKNIKNANTQFKQIYKDAFEYGFSSQETETKYYSQIHKINKVLSPSHSSKISQCYLSIDVNHEINFNSLEIINVHINYLLTFNNLSVYLFINLSINIYQYIHLSLPRY